MDVEEEITDEMVWDINREKVMMAPERIRIVTQYILEHFDQKTYRGDKTYIYNTLTNITEVASAKRDEVEEIKQKQRISGFNSILQYQVFRWQNCIIRNLRSRWQQTRPRSFELQLF